jgi:branched-chain amino acid transport system ATP-binding protein
VHDLSFEAMPRRITSIIGPNGAGKSTAFNLIAGTLRPDSGGVELDGQDVTGKPSYKLARLGVARSFQITNLFFGLSVLENVRLACQSRERRTRYLVRSIAWRIPWRAPPRSSRNAVSTTMRVSWSATFPTAISAGSRSRSRWRSSPRS